MYSWWKPSLKFHDDLMMTSWKLVDWSCLFCSLSSLLFLPQRTRTYTAAELIEGFTLATRLRRDESPDFHCVDRYPIFKQLFRRGSLPGASRPRISRRRQDRQRAQNRHSNEIQSNSYRRWGLAHVQHRRFLHQLTFFVPSFVIQRIVLYKSTNLWNRLREIFEPVLFYPIYI